MQEKDNKENYFLEGFIIVMNQEGAVYLERKGYFKKSD